MRVVGCFVEPGGGLALVGGERTGLGFCVSAGLGDLGGAAEAIWAALEEVGMCAGSGCGNAIPDAGAMVAVFVSAMAAAESRREEAR